MRIAAIDIGTNSVHMVIARATPQTGLEVLDREREVVQIGRGSFRAGRLSELAMTRTADALARFVRLARSHQVDRLLCTATAAVREARNGGEFLARARAASGITPRVIPPEVEGRTIYLAVRAALELDETPSVLIDIGGGSVQLVVGTRDRLLHVVSVPLGSLRLAETHLTKDPPTERELGRLERLVENTATEAVKTLLRYQPRRVYGSSGAIHALAQAAHWLEHGEGIEHVNGHVFPLDALRPLARQLRRMPLAERRTLRGLDDKRAEIIVPGAIVLERLLLELGAKEITLSDFSLREGLVLDFVQQNPAEVESHEIPDLRLRSVLQLLARFHHDETHPRHVAELALQLFDGFARAHRLDGDARDLLHYAALLHDVGSVVGYDRHAEHSHYIIQNGNLRGFSGAEIDVVAHVARYHGKTKPRRRDTSYDEMPKASRRVVRWLAGLLRIAEGLDRSHFQRIRRAQVRRSKGGYSIRVTAGRDAQLELWAAQRRTDLLESLLRQPVRIALAGRSLRPAPRPPARARSKPAVPRTKPRARRAPRGPSPRAD